MIDINFIRTHPEEVKANYGRRKDPVILTLLDEFLTVDSQWRDAKTSLQDMQKRRNEMTRQIAELKKRGEDISQSVQEMKDLPQKIKDEEDQIGSLFHLRHQLHLRLPNLMHETVPYGKDDSENVVVRSWGKASQPSFELVNHAEFIERLGLGDFDKATKISGSGFYFLYGDIALLNQALIRFAIEHLVKKGFLYVEPPLMMRKEAYEGVTDLSAFSDVLYKAENEDLYMIATSEHPLVGQFLDEVVDEDKLPIMLAGYSMCFRKEVGSRGIDTKGLYRTHQFNKVEQVVICKPEDSWRIHEEILKNSEEIVQALGLPYRIVNICTGDLGIVAAKKYDLEVWMPRQNKYGEACSASNCTDYQSRRLNIKYGKRGGETSIAHTLNNTALATSRILVAILENYQNADGTLTVPEVLVPFMMGKKVIGMKSPSKSI